MLTAGDIASAKKRTKYRFGDREIFHENDDCIRIAYEWLDAQVKTKGPTKKTLALKHIIEKWGGRYVSQSDVEVAAEMHPEIQGIYPHFNISAQLTKPAAGRLKSTPSAHTQDYSMDDRHIRETYSRSE